jgi:sugar lactone lactonase YvrE
VRWRYGLILAIAGCGTSDPPGSASCPVASASTTPLAKLDLVAGQPGGPGWVDGPLAIAHLADPWAITGDATGHLYVIDGNTVRVVDTSAGRMTTLVGAYAQVGSADGTGPAASFNQPSGLALLGGELLITDTENNDLRQIDIATGAVTTIAGAAGQTGTLDAVGTAARFDEPEGLSLDGKGTLYITDTNNDTVRAYALDGGGVTTVAGMPAVSGAADGPGVAAQFHLPRATAIDEKGVLYIADAVNQSIRMLDTTTGAVSTLVTFGVPRQGPVPQGVALDGADLYVSLAGASPADNRVVRVAMDGTTTTIAGSATTQGYVDGPGNAALFDGPAGLWTDGAGTLYVADEGNAVVRAVDLATSAVTTYAGAQSAGSSDGTGTAARFTAPEGVATDGTMAYVADTGNDTIRAVVLATGQASTLAGSAGVAGFADGSGSQARLNHPEGVVIDCGARVLYVADTGNRRIRRVGLGDGSVSTLGFSIAKGDPFIGFDAPSGLVLDDGRLFVTDYTDDVVISIDLATGKASTVAGQYGVPGRTDGAAVAASFYGPLGLTSDGHGHLYVADDLNETVRAIDVASGVVSTLAGTPVVPGSRDGTGASALFHFPVGVAADGGGNLFVCDLSNNTVRHIDVPTGVVTTVIGAVTAAGVELGPLPAQLTLPFAIALTPTGGLLVLSENSLLLAH